MKFTFPTIFKNLSHLKFRNFSTSFFYFILVILHHSTVKSRDSRDPSPQMNNMNSNKPPPLSQIHHSKINQRQDSNISSDSMMSSPGYNTKNMEAPLLKNASRMNKSKNIHHQSSADSFIMSSLNKTMHRGVHSSRREDSSVSSDSFSQSSSSPGSNSKLSERPLMANAVKLHTCKRRKGPL